jgi:amino acid transporter
VNQVLKPNESGGEPQLERVMGPFASFAIAMSTICILAGGMTSFHIGYCSVGGAAIGLGWPLCCLFSLAVTATMGQVASAFPRAGGPYQWSAILGGRAWGWLTACLGLAGPITALAALNVGTCTFVVGSLSRRLGYDPATISPLWYGGAAVLVTVSQALINHMGMRLTSRLVDLGGYLIIGVAVVLTASMLFFGVIWPRQLDPSRLWTFTNYSGAAGGGTWPPTASVAWLFALGLLLPAYTITGFDASAQTAEETIEPRRNVPRGIVRAVLLSGLAGWVMLSSVVLAIPPAVLESCPVNGDQTLFVIIRAVVPQPLRGALYTGIIAAMYVCGLAVVASVSRMAYGFARDGGLPFSGALRRIGSHGSPSVAIWAVAGVTALTGFLPYGAVAAVCAIFLYAAYVLPTVTGLLAYRRWVHLSEWHIGPWYRPLAALAAVGCAFLIVIGMQPPCQIAMWVVGGTVAVLLALWFGYMRRHFPGPPAEVLRQLHEADAQPPKGDPASVG